jgi:hypothetical protein
VSIVDLAKQNRGLFPRDFLDWLPDNLHVWEAFVMEAVDVYRRGYRHYSARTIIHFLRHHSNVREFGGDGWKINNNHSPYLARLFDLRYPEMPGLWAHRETPKAKREEEVAA